MPESGYYPDGAQDDPNAPYNEKDESDYDPKYDKEYEPEEDENLYSNNQ